MKEDKPEENEATEQEFLDQPISQIEQAASEASAFAISSKNNAKQNNVSFVITEEGNTSFG